MDVLPFEYAMGGCVAGVPNVPRSPARARLLRTRSSASSCSRVRSASAIIKSGALSVDLLRHPLSPFLLKNGKVSFSVSLFVVCCLLCVVCCLLFVVCCLLFV